MGDGGNDIEMLGRAGLGIATGEAGPSVKQAADADTTGVNADGLDLLLEKAILRPLGQPPCPFIS